MSWCRREKTLSSSVVNVSKEISTLVRISELHKGFSNWKKLRYDSIKKDQLYLKIFTIACRNNEWNLNAWWEDNSLRFSPRCRNRTYSISLLWVIIIIIFNYFVLNPMLPSFCIARGYYRFSQRGWANFLCSQFGRTVNSNLHVCVSTQPSPV